MPAHPSEEPMQTANKTAPKAWTADDVRQDDSWVQRLSAAEVEGFDLALQHARRLNKPLLAMAQAAEASVDISELQSAASGVIARCTGAQAGIVTSGAAAGLTLATFDASIPGATLIR